MVGLIRDGKEGGKEGFVGWGREGGAVGGEERGG